MSQHLFAEGEEIVLWQKENEMQEGRLRQKADEWCLGLGERSGGGGATQGQCVFSEGGMF